MTNTNKNRPGYKKTKIGWIPVDWEVEKLENCFKLSSGATKPEDTSPKYFNGAYPVFGGNGVLGYSKEYSQDGEKLIIGRVGEYCGMVRYNDEDCWITDNALFTNIIYKNSNPLFLYYILNFRDLSRLRNKGGQPLVSQKPIYLLRIPLPPLPEQKKIAEILSTWDRAVAIKELIIKKLILRKKALMQKLLTGKVRFKEFEGQEWKKVRLKDILEVKYGKSQKEVESQNGDYPILGTGGEFGRAKSYLYDKESVLIGRKGTIDKPFFMDKPFWTVDTLFYTHVRENGFAKWLYYTFLSIPWRKYNEASGVPSLNAHTIKNIKVKLPSLAEQRKIASVLTAQDKQIDLLKKQKNALEQQKKGLMQKLLTGEVRVKVS